MADSLSKAEFKKFRQCADLNGWPVSIEPAQISGELLRWLDKPTVDFDLASKSLSNVVKVENVIGFN